MRLLKYLARLSLLCVFASGVALADGQSPAFANGGAQSQCVSDAYGTADEAKANYQSDCGRPFENTVEFRCDWVPGGWQCSGPAVNDAQSTPSSQPSESGESNPTNDNNGATDCSSGFGGVYGTADEAKANYQSDCGRPFENTVEFRCDWVPDGWQCSGPVGNIDAPPASNEPAESIQPPSNVPALERVEVLSVTWLDSEEQQLRIGVRDNANRDRDGYNIYRNGEYWKTFNSTLGALLAFTDLSIDDTVVYEIQAFRHTEDGTQWGPKEVAIIPFDLREREIPEPNHTGNGGVTDQSAAQANIAAIDAQNAQADADAAFADFQSTFMPTEIGLDGPTWDPREITEAYFVWDELDERAERFVRGAVTMSNLHSQCVASPSSCYLNPPPNENDDHFEPVPQFGGNEGPTQPGDQGDGSRPVVEEEEEEEEPQFGGNEGPTQPGDQGDGSRG